MESGEGDCKGREWGGDWGGWVGVGWVRWWRGCLKLVMIDWCYVDVICIMYVNGFVSVKLFEFS